MKQNQLEKKFVNKFHIYLLFSPKASKKRIWSSQSLRPDSYFFREFEIIRGVKKYKETRIAKIRVRRRKRSLNSHKGSHMRFC